MIDMKDFFQDLTIGKVIAMILVFISPIAWIALGIVSLIILDFITGIIAAKKTRDKITSKKMSKSIYKLIVYLILMLAALIADKSIGQDIIVHCATYFLVLIEIFSIGENFHKIFGISFISYLKSFIGSKIKVPDEINKDK